MRLELLSKILVDNALELDSEKVTNLARIYRKIQTIEYDPKVVRKHKTNLETCEPPLRDLF